MALARSARPAAAVRVVLGGQPAAGRRQCGDVVEEPVLCLRRQVHQQPLGAPRRRLAGVETAVAQAPPASPRAGRWRRCDARRSGWRPARPSSPVLNSIDLRLVDFVDDGAGRPGQPVRPGVRARTPGSRPAGLRPSAGVEEEVVEEPGAHRHHVGHHAGAALLRVVGRGRSTSAVDQLGEEVDADGADQRCGVGVVDEWVRLRGWPARGRRPPWWRWHRRWRRGPSCRSRCGSSARRRRRR